MRKITLFFSLFLLSIGLLFAQSEPQAEIVFEKSSFDFGDIKQGEVVNAVFKFKNTGKAPLYSTKLA
jgi:hypothetical protein